MNARTIAVAAGIAGALAVPVLAQIPDYATLEMQARPNLNLPTFAQLANVTPDINNSGQIAFKFLDPNGGNVWLGDGNGSGTTVYTAGVDPVITDATLNDDADIVWGQTFSAQDGLYWYDADAGSSGFLTALPLGTSSWGSPQIADDESVGFRASFSGSRAWVSYLNNATAIHVAEATSPYTFLYTPSYNNQRQIAGKVDVGTPGSHESEIRVFETDGSSVRIAATDQVDPNSPWDRFDNSVGLSDNGYVSFIARDADTGDRAVVRSDGVNTVVIASEADADVSEIEFFQSVVNDNGLVAFRAFDGSGDRSVFVGDGTELRKVITVGDTVEDPLVGTLVVGEDGAFLAFSGSPAINDRGDIVINAGLNNTAGARFSAAILTLEAIDDCIGNIDGDGDTDFDDLGILLGAFGQSDAGDLDGDGDTDFDDLGILLGDFGCD